MRFFVIKQNTSLASLAPQLLKQGRSVPGAVERLRDANPHLDADSIGKGTVVLVPDSADFKAQGEVPGSGSFSDFVREASAALHDGGGQMRAAVTQREEQDKEVAKILKSAAFRKRAADDTQLRKHVEATQARADDDATAARETLVRYEALEKGVASELKKLQKLLD